MTSSSTLINSDKLNPTDLHSQFWKSSTKQRYFIRKRPITECSSRISSSCLWSPLQLRILVTRSEMRSITLETHSIILEMTLRISSAISIQEAEVFSLRLGAMLRRLLPHTLPHTPNSQLQPAKAPKPPRTSTPSSQQPHLALRVSEVLLKHIRQLPHLQLRTRRDRLSLARVRALLVLL